MIEFNEMMNKKMACALLISSLGMISIFAQKDPEALKILDRFSSAALSAPSVSMNFDLITDDRVEDYRNTVPASVIISKDMYKLDLKDNIIWFNGKTSWNYLPVEKEVTITEPEKDDDSFLSKPSGIFTMYKKGFKVRLVDETAEVYTIDLYPEDIKSDYIRIRLGISKPSLDLKKLEYKNKNGLTVTLNIKDYDLSRKPDASVFAFNKKNYGNVEIVDLR